MKELQKYSDPNISQEELDSLTRQLLNAKISRDKKQRWAQVLEQERGFKKGDNPSLKIVSSNKVLRWSLSVAAAVLLLIAAAVFLWNPAQPSASELALQYMAEEKIMGPQTRKGDVEVEALSQQAFDFYHAGKYAEAIEQWKQLEALGSMQTEDYFFNAMSFLKTSQLPEAINYFRKVKQQADVSSKFQKEATWLLALSLVQNGDATEAKSLLQEVIADGWRREKAEALLKSLETE